MLIYIYIGLLIASMSLLLAASFLGYKRLAIVTSVTILSIMNYYCIFNITVPLGFGSPVFLTLFVAAGLILTFKINPFAPPSQQIGISDTFIILLLVVTLLSVTTSNDVERSIKSVISLASIIFIGWFVLGNIFKKNSAQSRELLILVADVFGALSLLAVVLVMIFEGQDVISQGTGDISSTISFLGIKVRRLQTEGFNATGVGASAALAILWLFSLLQRVKRYYVAKVLISVLAVVSLVGLFWSGSRGAIVAFFATWISVRILGLTKRRMILPIIGTLILLGASLFLFLNYFEGILYRGYSSHKRPSLYDLFITSRLNNMKYNMSMALEPGLFGHGYGSSSSSDKDVASISVESFFVRMFIELGAVGSTVYVITFIILTFFVVRADRKHYLMGERGAFFPSAILIFVWMNSPTSFGFSLPVGSLAIQLALAAGTRSYGSTMAESRACKVRLLLPAKLP